MIERIIETRHGTYKLRELASESTQASRPYTVFLPGGPGFNSVAERTMLGPHLRGLRLLWFDLLGCGETTVREPGDLSWKNQHDDIATIVREVAREPVNIIAHCLAAHSTHELVQRDRRLVRSVVWLSPAYRVSDVFKTVLRRATDEGHLSAEAHSECQESISRLIDTPDERYGRSEVDELLRIVARIPNVFDLYWEDRAAMAAWAAGLATHPFNLGVFAALQADFFSCPREIPRYDGIPIRFVCGGADRITLRSQHVDELCRAIPHADVRQVAGAGHWVHLERPEEAAGHVLDHLLR